MEGVSELYCAIIAWAAGKGAGNIAGTVWEGVTDRTDTFPPITVRINAKETEESLIPPFHALLMMADYFPGFIGIIGPTGGSLLASQVPGEDERGLIDLFEGQTVQVAA